MRYTVHAVTVLALALGAAPARAQNPGLPVYNLGVPRGIALYGDVGFPNDAGGRRHGVRRDRCGRASAPSAPRPRCRRSIRTALPAADVAVGGTLNYKLLGGPLVPLSVTLQAGVSYAKPGEDVVLPGRRIVSELTSYHFPIGIGFALVIPNPVLSIQPWLAPRVDIAYTKAGGASNTETNFGLSGGLELNLLNGFGIHAAYDRVFAKDVADPATFGIGAHYAFRVPGL